MGRLHQHRRHIALGVGAIAPGLILQATAAAVPVLEDETTLPNNTVTTSHVLDAEVTHVIGTLGLLADPSDYDYNETAVLAGNRANIITFSNLPSGEPFFAWIDNSDSGIDTVLGTFDDAGTILSVNDDGSPLGTGVASGAGGQVNPDGTIVLGVSGFPDFNFDGQYTVADTEGVPSAPNAQSFEPAEGDYTLYVQLGVTDPSTVDIDQADHQFPGRIEAGQVGEFTISDVSPSTPFVAWVDNGSSGVDTVMGVFSASGELVLLDDDGSLVGTGTGSAIASVAAADGTIRLKVSTFPDFNFNGQYDDDAVDEAEVEPFPPQSHGMEGAYEVFVKLGITQLAGDVDFYTYVDLEPGQPFTAEVMLANFDPRLGWFDADGQAIQSDDDSGEGTLSRLTGTVPESGTLTFAVTGFDDEAFAGTHTMLGDYVLRLTVAP